jgi:tryptophan synthase alpha chain
MTIADKFEELHTKGEGALVPFITAGDPSLGFTRKLAARIASAGADLIELGIPFSDPLADGPSIQASSQRALEGGATLDAILGTSSAIASESPDCPIVLMTYYNPVLRYGLDEFASRSSDAGVGGVIISDLPPDEAHDWLECARAKRLDTIFLLAPTSTDARIHEVAEVATGFVYCVSRTGVTGARQEVPPELSDLIKRIRSAARIPVCVGFGISSPEHVRSVCSIADGAVVGSALIDKVAAAGSEDEALDAAARFVAELSAATNRGQEGSAGVKRGQEESGRVSRSQ